MTLSYSNFVIEKIERLARRQIQEGVPSCSPQCQVRRTESARLA